MNKLIMMIGAAAVAVGACADTVTTNGVTWTFTASGSNATLGDGTDPCIAKDTSVDAANIPWTFTKDGIDYTVTAIAANAFKACSGLSGTLTIPDAVTSMGDAAFYTCHALSRIESLGGVTSLPDEAFRMSSKGLSQLPGSDYPDMSRIVTIGKNVFNYSRMGGTVRLDALAGYSNCDAVFQNAAITNVVFPRSGFNLSGNNMFNGCTGLKGVYVPGPDESGAALIRRSNCFKGCTSLKVFLVGPRTWISTNYGSSDTTMFDGVTGCLIFVPAGAAANGAGWDDLEDYVSDNVITHYGSGLELDLSFDHDAKTITATPATAYALTNVLNAASIFKSEFGYDTRITMTNAIEVAEGTITDAMLSGVAFESLIFNVKTQAQLDMVLAATAEVSIPLCIDPTGAKAEMTLPADRKVWVLLSGTGKYRPKIKGLIITFL